MSNKHLKSFLQTPVRPALAQSSGHSAPRLGPALAEYLISTLTKFENAFCLNKQKLFPQISSFLILLWFVHGLMAK